MAKKVISFKNEETGQDFGVDVLDIDRQEKLKGQGFTTDFKGSLLNAATLKSEPNLNFQSFQEPPIFDASKLEVSDFTPPQQLTRPEGEAVGFENRIKDLRGKLLGESEFRAAQEDIQGIPELTATQKDLEARLKALQNEASAIPLQLQQDSIGRGRTGAGLRPLQTARLRENAIQTLQTASNLEASRGNLETALTLADRAIAQKFDPIREEINVLTSNLDLIKSSPRYSLAEKNRAQRQLDIQNKKNKQLAEQEAEEKAIMGIAVNAAQAGVDATVLRRIQEADSQVEATQIAQQAGLFSSPEKPEQFTLSPGQVRFDEFGRPIAVAEELPPSELELREFGLKEAEFGLREAETVARMQKTQAEIQRIYNDIETGGEIDVLDYQKSLLEIRKLQQDINKTQAAEDKKKIDAGNSAEVLTDKVGLINDLLGHAGMNSAVGIIKAGRVPVLDFISGNKSDFVAGINQLVSKETMDTLTALKAKGGTLGALSDQERIMLQNAATKFGSWAVKDKNGNIVGFKTTEGNVRKELNKIREQTQKLLEEAQRVAETETIGTEAAPGGEYSW